MADGKLAVGRGIVAVQRVFRDVFNAEDLAVDGTQFQHLFAEDETFRIAVFVGDTLFMPDCSTSVAEQRAGNVHVRDSISEDAFLALRRARDASQIISDAIRRISTLP